MSKIHPDHAVACLAFSYLTEGKTIPDTAVIVGLSEDRLREVVRWVKSEFGTTVKNATILRCVLNGLSNKAIARGLHVTESAVEYHVTKLLLLEGVSCRTQLLAAHLHRVTEREPKLPQPCEP